MRDKNRIRTGTFTVGLNAFEIGPGASDTTTSFATPQIKSVSDIIIDSLELRWRINGLPRFDTISKTEVVVTAAANAKSLETFAPRF